MSKCFKCSKVSKEGLVCCSCGCVMHGKCVGLSEDLINSLAVVKNLKLFCDECLNSADGFKSFKKIDALSIDVKKVIDFNVAIIENLNDLQKQVIEPSGGVDKVLANTLIEESVDRFENEMERSWASVVGNEIKKNLVGVSEE